ncbi:MAG: DUF4493 domain-containing protein [Bacteroidales bacterium]|nr:DUF4493 domain-containing protein [Bacteroidales bacterium]
MKRFRTIIALLTIVSIASCSGDIFNDVDINGLSKDEGLVEFNLGVSNSTTQVKANEDLNLDPNDFSLEVYNSKWVKFKKWKKFSEVKGEKVKFNEGTFMAKAYYGDSTATGFDAIYFADQKYFKVEGQQITTLSLTGKQANVGLKTEWGPNVIAEYSDYTVKAYRKGFADSLTFVKTETRTGYIPSGTIKFVFYLTSKSTGQTRRVSTSALDIVGSPNDLITLKIDTKEAAKGDLNVTFSIDSEMGHEQKDVIIPSQTLAKDAPKISSDNITGGVVTLIDGNDAGARLDLNAQGYIASCVMETQSEYLSGKGWPSNVDLANLNDAASAILEGCGLQWLKNMNGEKLAFIDFKDVAKKLVYINDSDINTFKITLTDGQGLVTDYSFSIKVNKADVQVASINNYDMWARWANVTMTTSNGDFNLLQLEYNGGNGWNAAAAEVISSGNGAKSVKVTGLTPGTTYKFRARYNGYTLSAEQSAATEAAAQVGNSSFEEYQTVQTDFTPMGGALGGGKYTRTWYLPYNSGDTDSWWACNSRQSMPNGHTGWTSTWCKNFPSSGYTTSAHSGSKAAKLFVVNIGNGNTDGTAIGTNYEGEIWIGKADDSGNVSEEGHSFASRPTALTFYYKYNPTDDNKFFVHTWVKDSAGNVIAEGEVRDGPAAGNWTKYTLNYTYSVLDKKAAKIFIRFSSCYGDGSVSTSESFELGGTSVTAHAGSWLELDDIELVY